MKRYSLPAILIALFFVFLLPRLPALNSFSTLDEPYWLSMGANFYYALGQREFDQTIYEYQPAVTTMWIVTSALLLYYPEYRGLGQGYLDYEKGLLDPFLIEHGKSPLALLFYSRLIQAFLITVLLLTLFHLLRLLLDLWPAFAAVTFAAFEPFFLGQSRLLDHEGMLSLFVLISILSLAIYLFQNKRILYLILSAVAGGLAQLTKSSAIALLIPIGVLLFSHIITEGRTGLGFGKSLLNAIKNFFAWLLILAMTYFIVWPGMWVAPGKMLYEVYGNAFSYAFQGARLKAVQGLDPSGFTLDLGSSGILELLRVLYRCTTPLTWLGAIFGFLALPFQRGGNTLPKSRLILLLLAVCALSFVLEFGLARGRNSPHYILSSFLSLSLLAGLGWFLATNWLGNRVLFAGKSRAQVIPLALIVGFQAWSALSFFPYYYTYSNPIADALRPEKQAPDFPYGEGLELAGRYLTALPSSESLTAVSYLGRGCFSYFFPGKTILLKPLYFYQPGGKEEFADILRESDYLVLYDAVQRNQSSYVSLFTALENIQPEKVIWLNGYRYATIYRVADFTPQVYERLMQ